MLIQKINFAKIEKTHLKLGILIILLGLIVLTCSFINFHPKSNSKLTIITGEENPGVVALYHNENGHYFKRTIPVGARQVWVVRLGDAKNDNHPKIYAGIGNSFTGEEATCQIIELDPEQNFKQSVVDSVPDLRCKDLVIGDVDNDGKNELILGTQGRGIVNKYSWDSAASKWQKETIDENFIDVVDKRDNTNHKIELTNIPKNTVLQANTHILRIGDVDNDGKNELIETVSDTLESGNQPHILLIRIFKYEAGKWMSQIIDTLNNSTLPFKSTVFIADVDKDGKNELYLGASHHQLIFYKFINQKWEKKVIEQETGGEEDNMKGVDIVNFGGNTDSILLATGIPKARVYKFDYQNGEFKKTKLFDVSELLKSYKLTKEFAENSLDVRAGDVDGDGVKEVVVSGINTTNNLIADNPNTSFFQWEATPMGYAIVLTKRKDSELYEPTVLDFKAVLGMDIGMISY